MSRILGSLAVAGFLTSVVLGAVYIVPPDWWGIRNSVRSSNVVVIRSNLSDSIVINGVVIKGSPVNVEYPCARIPKINCGGAGTPRLYGQIVSFLLYDSSNNTGVSAVGFDLRGFDNGSSFFLCGVGAGSDGRVYIAKSCSGVNPESDYCETSSDSYVMVNVYQVCQ